MIEKFIQDALIIWATIDPIGTMAIFVSITAGLPPEERQQVAQRTVIYAGTVLVGAIVIGQVLLTAMGIRLLSLQLGGGIILFLFGLQMIFGTPHQRLRQEPEHDIAVFPLAIPGTATPGAILAVILLTDNHIHSIPTQIGTAMITIVILNFRLISCNNSRIDAVVCGSKALVASSHNKILGDVASALAIATLCF